MKHIATVIVLCCMLVSLVGCSTYYKHKRAINDQIEFIERFGRLKQKGLITEEEYERKKQELLSYEADLKACYEEPEK